MTPPQLHEVITSLQVFLNDVCDDSKKNGDDRSHRRYQLRHVRLPSLTPGGPPTMSMRPVLSLGGRCKRKPCGFQSPKVVARVKRRPCEGTCCHHQEAL